MTIDDHNTVDDAPEMACCRNKVYNGFCEEHGFLRAGRTLDSAHPYFLPSQESQPRIRANIPSSSNSTRQQNYTPEKTKPYSLLKIDDFLLGQYFKYFDKN